MNEHQEQGLGLTFHCKASLSGNRAPFILEAGEESQDVPVLQLALDADLDPKPEAAFLRPATQFGKQETKTAQTLKLRYLGLALKCIICIHISICDIWIHSLLVTTCDLSPNIYPFIRLQAPAWDAGAPQKYRTRGAPEKVGQLL